jgi:hypothetical protein
MATIAFAQPILLLDGDCTGGTPPKLLEIYVCGGYLNTLAKSIHQHGRSLAAITSKTV